LLELYIKTEAMRFEDKFNYEIRIADDLDPDDVLIPTMILQPFAENAIWHGLSNKAGGGKILVEFKIEDDSLVCAVEDNGIGRQAAAESQKGKKHESKALGITQKRLELLKKETGKEAGYRVLDLVAADGSPAGTRVELIIPLI
jgi:sensor histidine kinase YesM